MDYFGRSCIIETTRKLHVSGEKSICAGTKQLCAGSILRKGNIR